MSLQTYFCTYCRWNLNVYLKQGTVCVHYEDQAFRKIIFVYCETRTKHINTICGEIHNLYFTADGKYGHHWALKDIP